MTTTTDLLALADRVEQAQAPSRKLDAEIAFHLEWGGRLAEIDQVHFDFPHIGAYRVWFISGGTVTGGASCYSRSLDVAMTLFPVPPDTISTNPRKVCAAALRARAHVAA